MGKRARSYENGENISTKNAYAIECFGAIEAEQGAVISASSEKKDHDIFCSGAVVDHGATFDGEIDALGGIHARGQN